MGCWSSIAEIILTQCVISNFLVFGLEQSRLGEKLWTSLEDLISFCDSWRIAWSKMFVLIAHAHASHACTLTTSVQRHRLKHQFLLWVLPVAGAAGGSTGSLKSTVEQNRLLSCSKVQRQKDCGDDKEQGRVWQITGWPGRAAGSQSMLISSWVWNSWKQWSSPAEVILRSRVRSVLCFFLCLAMWGCAHVCQHCTWV